LIAIAVVVFIGCAPGLNGSILGLYSVDGRRVVLLYPGCLGEVPDYVELTVDTNGQAESVWRLDTSDALSSFVSGLSIPVDLEQGRSYEVVVHQGSRHAGEKFTAGALPRLGHILVRGKTLDAKQFDATTVKRCQK
jgi:hypothetical protein